MGSAPATQPQHTPWPKRQRIKIPWFTRPEGRSKFLAVPHRTRICQDAHTPIEELVYRHARWVTQRFKTSLGEPVVQFSAGVCAKALGISRISVRRARAALVEKHSLEIFSVEHPGGKRFRGEGNNKATYFVIPSWPRVLAARANDPHIGKDRRGWMYVLGRGKHFLSQADIDGWQLNNDYGAAPEYATVPQGGEEELAAWERDHPNEAPQPVDEQPLPLFAEPPPPPPPPAEAQEQPKKRQKPPRREGKVSKPPEAVWAFAGSVQLRPGWAAVWTYIDEMQAEARRWEYELPVEVLAELMELQLQKFVPKRSGDPRPKSLGWYYGVRELVTPDVLEQHQCPRTGKLDEWYELQRGLLKAKREQQAQETALAAELAAPDFYDKLADRADQRVFELRQALKHVDESKDPQAHAQLTRELAEAEREARNAREDAEMIKRAMQ